MLPKDMRLIINEKICNTQLCKLIKKYPMRIYQNNNLFLMEGLEGIVEFVNICNKNNLTFPKINPFWNLDVDYDKSPTKLVVAEKPFMDFTKFQCLNQNLGQHLKHNLKIYSNKLMQNFIYALRLYLQPDTVILPKGCKLSIDTIGKQTMKKNFKAALDNYNYLIKNIDF